MSWVQRTAYACGEGKTSLEEDFYLPLAEFEAQAYR